MRTILQKYIYSAVLFSFLFIFPVKNYAQFLDTVSVNTLAATESSGEKPQSKVWKHDASWWAVIPDSTGTHIFRLVGSTWVKGLQLSTFTNFQADTKNDGDITYILLLKGTASKLITVQYDDVSNTHSVSATSNISLAGVETATIDIDSNDRMWLAYEASNKINVQWSNSPFIDWTNPVIELASGVATDDICAVTAFNGNKIGVLWSNQSSKRFGFKYHEDVNAPSSWSNDEIPALQSAVDTVGSGMADDHINFAVGSDGTIYSAVKTGYDTDGEPTIALLVRRSTPISGSNHWEDLHTVRDQQGINREPTRPIALLDEVNNKIYVIYTQDVGGDDIMYKYSSTTNVSFPIGDGSKLIPNVEHNWNDATSTKQSFDNEVVVLASSGSNKWKGVIAGLSPLPVELAYFNGALDGNVVQLRWRTETEVNNYGFDILRQAQDDDWITIGFVEGNGNTNSPRHYDFWDEAITNSGTYNYRLKQIDNDGTFDYSNVVTLNAGVPDNFYLSQNYPNPFNPSTSIQYTVSNRQFVLLKVYDVLGKEVATLVNEEKPAGTYTVTFDASSTTGGLPSGIYIYRLQTEDYSANRKMTLLK
jgi:hypothetical protein